MIVLGKDYRIPDAPVQDFLEYLLQRFPLCGTAGAHGGPPPVKGRPLDRSQAVRERFLTTFANATATTSPPP